MKEEGQQQPTRGFREPLYAIAHDGKILAVVGANSPEHALLRAESIRHHVRMPRHELLHASFVESGPVTAPFFAGAYFQWMDSIEDDAGCPVCGK